VLLDMARREKMTLRDLYNVTAAARGHWVIYGTPKRIADIFEEWFTGGMAGRFVIMPAYSPARSMTSSTRWFRNCSGAGFTGMNTSARRCARTWVSTVARSYDDRRRRSEQADDDLDTVRDCLVLRRRSEGSRSHQHHDPDESQDT
jgi:hypothetical protein